MEKVQAFMLEDDFAITLSRLETDINEIAKKAIYAGAKIVADTMKVNLEGVLSDDATGKLVEALGITQIGMLGGEWSAHVGFDGYDSNGVAFQLIARVIESGTSDNRDRKKPFVRPTMNQTKTKVAATMKAVVEEEMKKIFG